MARPAIEFQEYVVVIMADDKRPTFLTKPTTSRAAVEVEDALTSPTASAHGAGDVQEEKKMDECKVRLTLVGGGDTTSQSNRDYYHDDTVSRSLAEDTSTQSHAHHHHDNVSSISGTAALQERFLA